MMSTQAHTRRPAMPTRTPREQYIVENLQRYSTGIGWEKVGAVDRDKPPSWWFGEYVMSDLEAGLTVQPGGVWSFRLDPAAFNNKTTEPPAPEVAGWAMRPTEAGLQAIIDQLKDALARERSLYMGAMTTVQAQGNELRERKRAESTRVATARAKWYADRQVLAQRLQKALDLPDIANAEEWEDDEGNTQVEVTQRPWTLEQIIQHIEPITGFIINHRS
jgi:hypothetical protein